MDTRQLITFEVKKGEFTFSFLVPIGATWGQSLDASFDIMQEMKRNIDIAIQAQADQLPKEE